jgi:hypothetical protein
LPSASKSVSTLKLDKKLQAKEDVVKTHFADLNGDVKDIPLFLYVGRFSQEKGIEYLHLFADYLEENFDNAAFVVMGPDPKGNKEAETIIEDLLKKQSSLKKCHLLVNKEGKKFQRSPLKPQNLERGKQIRLASDFTIVPSKAESCGIVPLEAFACGSVVISSAVQGMKDFVKSEELGERIQKHKTDEHNAITYNFEEANAITNKTKKQQAIKNEIEKAVKSAKKLFSDIDEMNKQAKFAYETSKKYYWSEIVGKYNKMYFDLLKLDHNIISGTNYSDNPLCMSLRDKPRLNSSISHKIKIRYALPAHTNLISAARNKKLIHKFPLISAKFKDKYILLEMLYWNRRRIHRAIKENQILGQSIITTMTKAVLGDSRKKPAFDKIDKFISEIAKQKNAIDLNSYIDSFYT